MADTNIVTVTSDLTDRSMVPILRPGSIVMVDIAVRRIEDIDWSVGI